MATKKAIKKVEITDESVLDLKAKDRTPAAGLNSGTSRNPSKAKLIASSSFEENNAGFSVHRIDSGLPVSGEMLRSESETLEPEVTVAVAQPRHFDPTEFHERFDRFSEKLDKVVIKVGSPSEAPTPTNVAADPKDLIKVKFEKFVQLVATKDFLSVLEKNRNEDVILSSNLLTELASAIEDKGERKSPVIFLVGLAIGVIITYLLVTH